ncbi:DUF262 domain-containing protein [Planobispora siamensis]|uniref:GmrSD restriction endonucleases N-terminal domain-containing protein n=1 Tax=Planobispora siamensis TaxID=936338 RepID=A0A8J3WP67_9ACTN|nr:DUF262 domain-containing protein [Planobispora siamensis]GIH95282.1 hypothetical protein Psi01_59120 [Planobispora siamensis]
MTHQTTAPIEHMSLQQTARSAESLIHMHNAGDLAWDPPHAPYQRGAVWTRDQQVQLIASGLAGIPIPAIIINRRDWAKCGPDDPYYVVIDGQQRLRTFAAWYAGELAVPASWWQPDFVEGTRETDDGPYVTISDLTLVGRRYFGHRVILPVAEASVPTIQEEAEIYLRVNGYGTVQSDDDLDNAARIAAGE